MEDELLKVLESVGCEPFDFKHHAVYNKLALRMRQSGEMAAHAWFQMVTQYQQLAASHTYTRCVSEFP